jgi:hypothetical protein
MSVSDLLRYLFMAAVALVILIVGMKLWGRQKTDRLVVRELRVLASETSSFEQITPEDAQAALFKSMFFLHLADSKLKKEPGEVLQKVFHGKGNGALFPTLEMGQTYTDPRETLIREGLLRNYQHCRTLGIFEESDGLNALEEGKIPKIFNGPATGSLVVIRHIINKEVSPGIEKLIPNMVISPPAQEGEEDGMPTDLEITQAKSLTSLLSGARLIEREAQDRIVEHYERASAPPEPEPEPEPVNIPEPDPVSIPKPAPDGEEDPFGKPLPQN